MPERPVSGPPTGEARVGDPLDQLVGEATGRGMPVDAGTIEIAAVETGPEVRRRRRRGIGIAGWLSLGWIVLVVGLALLAPVLPIDDPKEINTAIARRGPFADAGSASGHLLGGDYNGRDMLSRLIWGGRTTLLVATSAVAVGFVFGGALGLVGGYFRGKIDVVVSGLLDVFLSIPAVILALALVVILRTQPGTDGGGIDPVPALILAIGLVSIPVLGRITRASTLSWSEREFVLAARAQGATHRRIMVREVLPNVLPAMFSIALLGIAVAIVAEGTLSILGAGVEADTPTWGNMIAIGRNQLQRAPHVVFEPAIMIFLTVLSLNMLGDVVRSRFDVREGGL
jgi:peptide/nickel transport system permease protein